MTTTKTTAEIISYIEERIHECGESLIENPDRADRSSMGQLNFYISLRNIIKDHQGDSQHSTASDMRDMPSYRDFGLMEAINDTLIFMGLYTPSRERRKFFEVDIEVGDDVKAKAKEAKRTGEIARRLSEIAEVKVKEARKAKLEKNK